MRRQEPKITDFNQTSSCSMRCWREGACGAALTRASALLASSRSRATKSTPETTSNSCHDHKNSSDMQADRHAWTQRQCGHSARRAQWRQAAGCYSRQCATCADSTTVDTRAQSSTITHDIKDIACAVLKATYINGRLDEPEFAFRTGLVDLINNLRQYSGNTSMRAKSVKRRLSNKTTEFFLLCTHLLKRASTASMECTAAS